MDTPEYRAIIDNYPKIVSSIQEDVADITVNLKKPRILASTIVHFIENPHHDKGSKARKLLGAVETQIQLDEEVFYIFIKALRDTGTRATAKIADELEQAANPASGAIVQLSRKTAPTPKSPPSQSDESHVPQASVSTSQTYTGAGPTGAIPPPVQVSQPPSHQPIGPREPSLKHTDFHISKGKGLSFRGDEDVWQLKKIHSELQLNGEGIKIAILDTGLFHHHHSFANKLAQIRWLNFVADPLGQQPLPCDTAVTFPGNHCTAIVSLALQVAPKATIYILRVSTSCNSGWEPGHVTAALDALLGMDDQTRPDIVSMSFGFPNHDYGWEDKIDELEKRGTICVAAAGNSGAYQKEIPPPACFSKVISVGSLSIHGEISGFTPKSRNIQVYAPGEDFQAPCLPDNYDSSGIVTTIADPNSPTVLTKGNILIEKNATSCVRGTSMATPVIAGLLALLFQHADRLTSGRCRKVRKSTFARSALTSHMQDAMGSQVLRPYEFFSKPIDFFRSYYT